MKNHCIIMAGGVGSRFWPVSREETPKQFLDFLGTGQSLIRQTYERFRSVCDPEDFLVVTSARYRDLVREHLPELEDHQILLEPMMRNTAPCIAYAAYHLAARSQEANLIVTPADHLILKQQAFEETLGTALQHISTHDHILTLGITPTRPDTGYGYIEYEQVETEIRKVIRFREKPDVTTAQSFLEQGNFSWNSGMFFFSLATILNAFDQHLPDMNNLFRQGMDDFGTDRESDFIGKIYPGCEEISIDYGILEKARNVHTLNTDIGWSDLGTWGSVYTQSEKDTSGNVVGASRTLLTDVQDCLIRTTENKVVVAEGLKDYIVVDTPDALLILPKKREQQIKQLRKEVSQRFGTSYV